MISYMVSDTVVYGSCLGVLLIWVVSCILIWRQSEVNTALRRCLYLLIGLFGVLMLIIRPVKESNAPSKIIGIVTDDLEHQTEKMDAVFADVYDFLNNPIAAQTGEVHIIGDGLSKDELSLLDRYRLVYAPNDLKSGITSIDLPKITENQSWSLAGTYQGDNIASISISIPNGQKVKAQLLDGTFAMNSLSPTSGDYLYTLTTVTTDGDTISDQLPVHIDHRAEWNLLNLGSYPSFEINYLKNYWTNLGYGYAQRTKIARDKYQSSYVNLVAMNLESLSSSELKNFDFLLCDMGSWNALPENDRKRILHVVRNEGLSLILKPIENDSKAVDIRHPTITSAKTINLFSNKKTVELNQYSIESQSNWNRIDHRGVHIASYQNNGLGHVMILSADATYQLVLADESDSYQELWATIFSALYRDFSVRSQLLHDQWIWSGVSTDIQLITNEQYSDGPRLNDTVILDYIQTPFISGSYELELYPSDGYQTISIGDGEKMKLFAHPKDTWQALRQNQLIEINSTAVKTHQSRGRSSITTLSEYPFYWWYILTLIGFGMVWLDERLY